MSSNDKFWMQRGYRVRHAYRHRRGCHSVCVRCGVKRRKVSSGWEYAALRLRTVSGRPGWSSENPPCVVRESS